MVRIPASVAAVVLGAAVAVVGVASPASAAKKPPVKLSGTVNNEGVGKATNGAVSIEADSFYFDKTFVKAAPGSVTVTVKNVSSVPHTFTVDGQGVDQQINPGETKTVTVDVTAGKPTVFYCRFHRGSGMQGALFSGKTKSAATSGSSGGSSGGSSSYGY